VRLQRELEAVHPRFYLFGTLLEQHHLTAAMFDAVKTFLTEQRLLLKAGTIVDATIIAVPSST
jgi:IS5 family transposase